MDVVRSLLWICILVSPAFVYSVELGHEGRSSPGVVESPAYPRPYPKESRYSWMFERPYGAWAVVFEEMDIEETEDCRDDYLLIRDPITNRELIRACGEQLPDPVYSAGPKILISFHSDLLKEGKGFRLHVYHDQTPEALRARLSQNPTTDEIKPAEPAEVLLSRDDILIYSLSLALLIAILVLICLGGWTVYHHCFRPNRKPCCGCSGMSGTKETVINMEPVQAPRSGKRYSKPRLKQPQPVVRDDGSSNVYLPMPDHETVDQSHDSFQAISRAGTDAGGTDRLPLFHTSQAGQFEEAKFIGVM
ncbi:uncharacterized protein LOC135476190 [Liolophura sinensis]|uniref:uncharacterized protein LOC135476190 n=1 Tax=Liolophura sinensis TaxID=3198878 RepID=UPI0031584021